jgi:hypothetical protein
VVDGWERKADQPGKRVSKHEVWEKTLPDGAVLRTVVSKGRSALPKGVFAAVLKRQLGVTAKEFWAAVDDGRPPARGAAATPKPATERLPHDLVRHLRALGYSLDEIRGLREEQAAALLRQGRRRDDRR